MGLDACAKLGVMKVVVLYRPNSEHSRVVEDYIRNFQSRHPGSKMEIINLDTREGSATATLYDVMQYPAFLVVQNDGYVQKMWEGDNLPIMDEIVSYATA
jgi:hypothetical protein